MSLKIKKIAIFDAALVLALVIMTFSFFMLSNFKWSVVDPVAADQSVCGDGVTEGLEECDDANLTDNDGCSSTCKREFLDIGWRVYDGKKIVSLAIEYPQYEHSPLKIAKAGVSYSVALVDPSDQNASNIRIATQNGIKAIRQLATVPIGCSVIGSDEVDCPINPSRVSKLGAFHYSDYGSGSYTNWNSGAFKMDYFYNGNNFLQQYYANIVMNIDNLYDANQVNKVELCYYIENAGWSRSSIGAKLFYASSNGHGWYNILQNADSTVAGSHMTNGHTVCWDVTTIYKGIKSGNLPAGQHWMAFPTSHNNHGHSSAIYGQPGSAHPPVFKFTLN